MAHEGKDSMINGIQRDTRLRINPFIQRCVNVLRELSTYQWAKDRFEIHRET